MGGESPQEQYSAELNRSQAQYANRLGDIAFPQLQDLLSRVGKDLQGGPGAIPPSVAAAYGQARTGVNQDYAMLSQGTSAAIGERAKSSGGIYSDEQLSTAKLDAARGLESERQGALKRLDLQEANAGMSQYDTLLNLLGAGAGTALNLGSGAAGNQGRALAGLSTQSPGAGALSGAMAGASLGSSVYPGWGTLIGGVVGAAGGYFGSGG